MPGRAGARRGVPGTLPDSQSPAKAAEGPRPAHARPRRAPWAFWDWDGRDWHWRRMEMNLNLSFLPACHRPSRPRPTARPVTSLFRREVDFARVPRVSPAPTERGGRILRFPLKQKIMKLAPPLRWTRAGSRPPRGPWPAARRRPRGAGRGRRARGRATAGRRTANTGTAGLPPANSAAVPAAVAEPGRAGLGGLPTPCKYPVRSPRYALL